MATFVLVHGAWHGGWCWQKVIPFLEAAGSCLTIRFPVRNDYVTALYYTPITISS